MGTEIVSHSWLSYIDVLWLWRAHNRVNWRLNQSGSEAVVRLGLPKIQFPSPSRCPACRAPSGKWREPLLLRHLTLLPRHLLWTRLQQPPSVQRPQLRHLLLLLPPRRPAPHREAGR